MDSQLLEVTNLDPARMYCPLTTWKNTVSWKLSKRSFEEKEEILPGIPKEIELYSILFYYLPDYRKFVTLSISEAHPDKVAIL